MKTEKNTLASTGLPILALAVLTGLDIMIFNGIAERDRLESHNDSERTMNILLSRLRDHDDFGSAIESDESLSAKVIGIAAYASDGARIYSWGEAPFAFSRPIPNEAAKGDSVRLYIDNPKNDSVALVFQAFGGGPPPKEPAEETTRPGPSDFFFTTLRKADFFYLEIREPKYWMRRRLEDLLFPVIELALGALVLSVRGLIMRNAEYRRRIEEQRNLVVLGTAASTLAHEIKNPLLSIRLQARILEKTCPKSARREIDIINDEVERLSALSHRVGDYLRDPAGNPRSIDPREIAFAVGMRLCGRDILAVAEEGLPRVNMDPERLRSVLENLVRNALESGGAEDGVVIQVGADDDGTRIDVLDRGQGISAEAAARIFDPFFTTKSRGTGIGLAVCRRFVLAAGGSLVLEARQDGGCRARLVLPAAAAAS
ncbi:MAG: HAMP domain-containing sensor histidine kinase [Spirochaetes bacterium]|nr:HAMP domain-containing sensor histidine kinase [Spirochaetota bacterium]